MQQDNGFAGPALVGFLGAFVFMVGGALLIDSYSAWMAMVREEWIGEILVAWAATAAIGLLGWRLVVRRLQQNGHEISAAVLVVSWAMIMTALGTTLASGFPPEVISAAA